MNNIEIVEEVLDCLSSMNEATKQAGGGPFTLQGLKDMSALDLLCRIAPNSVRFIYTAPRVSVAPETYCGDDHGR